MYLENRIYEKISYNNVTLEIGKDIRGVIFKKVTNQNNCNVNAKEENARCESIVRTVCSKRY